MTRDPVDLLVIGAGSGGLAASRRAAELGASVVLVEPGRVGGTCVHRGCVPKKLLVYAAGYGDAMIDAAGFGWHVGDKALDWKALIAAKDAELDRLEGIYRANLTRAGVHLLPGAARFIDAHSVEVGGERLSAKSLVIATGGASVRPDIEGASLGILSSDALSLPSLPRRLVVVGGGYIAAELACMFHSAGVHVVVVLRDDAPLRGFDHDVRTWLLEGLRAQGIDVRVRVSPTRLTRGETGIETWLDDGSHLVSNEVLFATGRAPQVDGLGLERAGVATVVSGAARAIAVDALSRTNVPHIFAVGDVTSRVALTPVAIAEGRAVAETLFGRGGRAVDYQLIPTAIFSRPEVARVGMTESAALQHHEELDIYVSSFRPLRHTLSGRNMRTSIKLIVDPASDRVLGLHIVGDDAAEIVGAFAPALTCGVTKEQLDRTMGIHPTASEELVTLRKPKRVRRAG